MTNPTDSTDPTDMTTLLQRWNEGDEESRDALIELTYAELRRIARNRLRGEPAGLTIDSTGLAHEAYEKLIGARSTTFENRAHFFAIAARTMRQLLVDRYRARNAKKRGAGATRVSLSAADLANPEVVDLEFLNRALDQLATQDQRQAQIVELRFFAGLTIEDTAETVGVSPATVKREWAMARAWLRRELADDA